MDSTETLDLGRLVDVLTSRDQGFDSRPRRQPYGWHEWGMYIGRARPALLVGGRCSARSRRETALKVAGSLFLLGFGAFHPYAPWTLLHTAPVFRSQHVPSRWLYPAMLVLALVFVAVLERGLVRLRGLRGVGELVLLACAAWASVDIARVARVPMAQMFGSHMPTNPVAHRRVSHRGARDRRYQYDGVSYGQASLPSEMANVGPIGA